MANWLQHQPAAEVLTRKPISDQDEQAFGQNRPPEVGGGMPVIAYWAEKNLTP